MEPSNPLQELKEVIADQHLKLTELEPELHRAIAECTCVTAVDYRDIKAAVDKYAG